MSELENGTKLSEIVFSDGEMMRSFQADDQCIEVVMVNGQMSLVPWAKYKSKGETVLVNLANVESVTIKEDEQ